MRGGADFHRLFGNVDIGELLKLMVHTGQLALDMFGGIWHALFNPGDVEKDAAVSVPRPALTSRLMQRRRGRGSAASGGRAHSCRPACTPAFLLVIAV